MENYVLTEVHNEFAKRIEEEQTRQNKRIAELEDENKKTYELKEMVNKLYLTVEKVSDIQDEQTKQIKALEARDGQKWRKLVSCIITAVATALVTFALAKLGIII